MSEDCKSNELLAQADGRPHPEPAASRLGCSRPAARKRLPRLATSSTAPICMAEPTAAHAELARALYAAPEAGRVSRKRAADRERRRRDRRRWPAVDSGPRSASRTRPRRCSASSRARSATSRPSPASRESALDCLHSGSGDRRQEPAAGGPVPQPRHPRPPGHRPDADQRPGTDRPCLGRGLAPRPLAADVPVRPPLRPGAPTYLVFGFGDLPWSQRPQCSQSLTTPFWSSAWRRTIAEPPAEPSLARRLSSLLSLHSLAAGRATPGRVPAAVAGGGPDRLPLPQRDRPGQLRHVRPGADRPGVSATCTACRASWCSSSILLVGWLLRRCSTATTCCRCRAWP